MAKLYPPYIEGTIPAFYYTGGTANITVPFVMNRAVSPNEVAGFALKIKTITGETKGVVKVTSEDAINTLQASVTFSTEMDFLIGQFYKIQLAYIDTQQVIGYYSTVGVIKCTTKPSVTIANLNIGQTNTHSYSYTGVYNQEGGDITEKMYSYRFILSDSNYNVILDSGEKLHNTSHDIVPYESSEEFLISQDLEETGFYYLQFIVTTVNKMVISSVKYRIMQRKLIPPEIITDLHASMNFENGYVALNLIDESDYVISGSFLLSRANSKNNYQWEPLQHFNFQSMPPENWSYKDFTVEQGIEYKYCLQQYNSQGIYSERIISNKVLADFEDMFLYDGQRQLKIRFNPKVSTYKSNILESKTETIGSKYPYFSRNGNVNYKEFAISGLISYFMDEAETFMTIQDIGLDGFENLDQRSAAVDPSKVYNKYKTTNLVGYNIAAERRFKNFVLDWLNNGQIKLFKTPAEGNYLVRLMNVSLSPTDSLGRMLHSFSASAYEVEEFNLNALNYYGLVQTDVKALMLPRWVTVDIRTAVQNYLDTEGLTWADLPDLVAAGTTISLNTRNASCLDFKDFRPGAHIIINSEDIQIGATGAYQFQSYDELVFPAGTIKYKLDMYNNGQLTYQYYTQAVSIFGTIDKMEAYDIPIRQFIGNNYIKDARTWDSTYHVWDYSSTNLLDVLNDARISVLNVVMYRAEKRHIEILYVPLGTVADDFEALRTSCYTDMYCTSEFDWSEANPLNLYEIRYKTNVSQRRIPNDQYYIDVNLDEFSQKTGIYVDGLTKECITNSEDLFTFYINNEAINLNDIEKYMVYQPKLSISNIRVNQGVVFEISYTEQIKVYSIETDVINFMDLVQKRKIYLNELQVQQNQKGEYTNFEQLKLYYNDYITTLNRCLDQYKEENGLDE